MGGRVARRRHHTTLNSDAQWQFAQFGNRVIATQANDKVQTFVLGIDTAFANLAGSPPDAAYVAVVGQFVVLSGLTANPFRVEWCALGDPTAWVAGTNQSDFQDLPDGGIVRQTLGGELGIILQDLMIRRMVYSPGSDVIFVIERIAKDIGLLHPYAATAVGDKLFFLTPKGFMQSDPSGGMLPIGAEKIDRTFLAAYDPSAPQLVLCAADPKSHLVVWTYRTLGMSADTFDAALAYNWLLQRWVPLTVEGEYITSLAQPGLTIEGLDAIAPGAQLITGCADNGSGLIRVTVGSTAGWTTGDFKTISGVVGTTEANDTWQITVVDATHIDLQGSAFVNAYVSGGVVGGSADLMETSWDAISTATLPALSVADSLHRLAFFNGATKEAVLETPEQSGDGRRLQVNGFWPVTDAATVFGSISKRQSLQAPITYTPESRMNADGFVAIIRSTRYARAKIRIPAAEPWTFASGARPLAQSDGEV
jgi:hypothetical protein